MADEKQEDKEVNGEVCGILQNKENYIRECSGFGVNSVNENSPGG